MRKALSIWDTGARPKEVRQVEARHVLGSKWVFPRPEAKGKRKPRVIHLTPNVLEIPVGWIDPGPTT